MKDHAIRFTGEDVDHEDITQTPFAYGNIAARMMGELGEALRIYAKHTPSRELSLAITNMEQAFMWLDKARTEHACSIAPMNPGSLTPEIDELCSMLGPLVTNENHDRVHQLLSFYYTEKVS